MIVVIIIYIIVRIASMMIMIMIMMMMMMMMITIVIIMMILRTIINNHHQLCHPAAAPPSPWSQRSRLCESSSASHCEGWRICVPITMTYCWFLGSQFYGILILWLDMAYNPDPKWDIQVWCSKKHGEIMVGLQRSDLIFQYIHSGWLRNLAPPGMVKTL